jgi:HSP20 family molecular chaperone IbpA
MTASDGPPRPHPRRRPDTSRVDARLKDGVLRLAIPKAEEAKPRRIAVQAG